MKDISIYTAGLCEASSGKGSFGVVVQFNDRQKELSAAYQLTTKNRMEIQAAIEGLQALTEPCAVTLYSGSQYLVDVMSKGWAAKWENNGWRKTDSKEIMEPDVMEVMLSLARMHKIEFVWMKEQAWHPTIERCKELGREAIDTQPLWVDGVYETKVYSTAGRAARG